MPNLQIKSLRGLQKVVQLMKSEGVAVLRVGDVAIQLEQDYSSFVAPPEMKETKAVSPVFQATNDYEDPDLYPGGEVPRLETE